MPKRTKLYQNSKTGIPIQISNPAETLIGPKQVAKFVETLHKLMRALGVKAAYVSKRGYALDVHLIGGPFISRHFKVKRGDEYE